MISQLQDEIQDNLKIQYPCLFLIDQNLKGDEPELQLLIKCKHLEELILSNNQLKDFSFLNELSSLKKLDLSENNLKEFPNLSGLNSLKTLNLSNNQFCYHKTKLSASYKYLEKLVLNKNQFQDVSFLNELTFLKELNMSDNQLDEFPNLSSLENLEALDLSRNKISDQGSFEMFADILEEIEPELLKINTPESDKLLKSLENFRKSGEQEIWIETNTELLQNPDFANLLLNKYDIFHTKRGSTLFFISSKLLPMYEGFNILKKAGNPNYLGDFPMLKKLDLSGNCISNIVQLSNLSNLEELVLSHNLVANINPLKSLKELKKLDLSGNCISNIVQLSNLSNLEELVLSHNLVTNINPLKNLKELKKLDLSGNSVEELQPDFLKCLSSLKSFRISMNPLLNIPDELYDELITSGNLKKLKNYFFVEF